MAAYRNGIMCMALNVISKEMIANETQCMIGEVFFAVLSDNVWGERMKASVKRTVGSKDSDDLIEVARPATYLGSFEELQDILERYVKAASRAIFVQGNVRMSNNLIAQDAFFGTGRPEPE